MFRKPAAFKKSVITYGCVSVIMTHFKITVFFCRFGKGYTLTIRCSSKSYEDVLKRISADLPMATVEDQHCLQLTFNIPQESAQLSTIFSTLIAYKNELIIEDYSVSQTTLDDIFVKFASTQTDSLDR